MAVHRNCKQRVDRVMEKARDPELSPLMLRSDTRLLVEEIEDVRTERDELYTEIGEAVHAWDELSLGEPMSQEFVAAMERLRDLTPFPRVR